MKDKRLSGNGDSLPGAVVIRNKEGAGWLNKNFKFFLSFSMSEKQSVCRKVLIRPIITTLIAKTTSQLLPCETQLAAVGVVTIPSNR